MADVDKNILLTVDVDAAKGEASTSKLAGALGGLRGKLGDARKGLNETAEAMEFNALVGGTLAAVIGGTLVGAVAKFIEQDKRAAEATERLGEAFDELLFTLGNAVVGGDNFAQTTDKISDSIGNLTKYVDENRESIFDFSRTAVVGLTHVAEWAAKTVLGVYGFFQFVVDGLQELFRQGFLGFLNLAEGVSEILGVDLGDNHYRLKMTVEADESSFRETERLAGLLDDIGAGAQKVRDIFEGTGGGTRAPISSAAGRRRVGGGGGGGGAAPAGDEITFTDAEAMADLFALQAEAALPGTLAGGAGGATIGSVTQDVGQLVSATDTLTASLEATDSISQTMTDKLSDGLNNARDAAISLGVSLTESLVTSFVNGTLSMEQWVASALSGIGDIAINLGKTAIMAGIASQAILTLSGGAAIGAGLGLVALGIGLKAAGGSIAGAKGAGALGREAVGVGAPSAPQLAQTRDRETTIVLEIDGQRVGAAVAPALEDMAQMGRLRLGRA